MELLQQIPGDQLSGMKGLSGGQVWSLLTLAPATHESVQPHSLGLNILICPNILHRARRDQSIGKVNQDPTEPG